MTLADVQTQPTETPAAVTEAIAAYSEKAKGIRRARRALTGKTPKRTDIHRPGAIIPADYDARCYYMLPGSDPFDQYNMEGMRAYTKANPMVKREGAGGAGTCGICGRYFRTGAIFLHIPSGESLHVGQNCAEKYEMLANWSAVDLALKRSRKASAVRLQADRNKAKRDAFLATRPALLEAFTLADKAAAELPPVTDENPVRPWGYARLEKAIYTVQDIDRRLAKYHQISDKQADLVIKLVETIKAGPAKRQEEAKVEAPTGRQTFRGIVVGARVQEGAWGNTLKMTVKITTEAGIWLAWGTAPEMEWTNPATGEKEIVPIQGAEVEVTATLTRGRDAHFALFKRPRGKVINPAPKA